MSPQPTEPWSQACLRPPCCPRFPTVADPGGGWPSPQGGLVAGLLMLACGVWGRRAQKGSVPIQASLLSFSPPSSPLSLPQFSAPCCLLRLWVCLSVPLWASNPCPLPWPLSLVPLALSFLGFSPPVFSFTTRVSCPPLPLPSCVWPPFRCPCPHFLSVSPSVRAGPAPTPTPSWLSHVAQQGTNKTVAASASALKQMAELLRGCSRVGGPGGRGGGPRGH